MRARGVDIADMYMSAGAVTQFTRDYVYLRPGTFVVYDRTTVADGSADQWTAWHTPTVPALVATTDATQRRFDISANGAVIGSVRSLLPENASSKLVNVMGTVTRIENHTPSPVSATDWLTVVSAGASVPDQVRLSTSDGNVTSGAAVGVLVLGSPNAVVLFSDDHAAAAQLSAVTYTVAQYRGRRPRAHRRRSVDERLRRHDHRLERRHHRQRPARRRLPADERRDPGLHGRA